MKNLLRCAALIVLPLSIAALLLYGCGNNGDIPVGFAGQLTGRQAELGVQERNGVLLAVEHINASGGIAGRPIRLMIRDDLGTPEGAKIADQELIKAGVVAIIGHATSSQTIIGVPLINAAHVVMLSPTATTQDLAGLDDYFFRVIPPHDRRGDIFARHICEDRRIKRLAVMYDSDNTAYCRSYRDSFCRAYLSMGCDIAGEIWFSSSARPDYDVLLSGLHTKAPDGLLIVASDHDTAFIAQRMLLMNWKIPMFTSAWAQTEILIKKGGRAVEGMEIEQAYALNSQKETLLNFKKLYQNAYGRAPSFGAAFGYEAAGVLAAALEKTGGKPEGLRKALSEIKNFSGLVDAFSMDKWGDVIRPFYVGAVHKGKFIDLKRIDSGMP